MKQMNTNPGQKPVLEEMDLHFSQRYPYGSKCELSCDTIKMLCQVWLEERHGNVKKSTYAGYYYCLKRHILPHFGVLPLCALNGENILAFIDKMQQKGLAETTVHYVIVVFKAVLKYGIQTHQIGREVLVYCSVNFRRAESKVLTLQDSDRMKEYLLEQNTVFAIAILLCRGTGIRIGELCGLKWEDINFSTKTIMIKRTISRIPNPNQSEGEPKTVLYIRTPKSHTSIREIPIPQYLIAPLQAMKREKNKYLLTEKETCTEPRNVQKKFKTILKHCEMQDCNFHAMRHGFATACLEKGIDCKTVSSILGHASTRTTMDFYVHTSLRQKQDCINAIT